MSKPAPLSKITARRVAGQIFAAWPCPSKDTPRRGWPSPEWKERYHALRKALVVGPAPSEEEVKAELFELQRLLRDAFEEISPPPDIASAWEESFAALERAARMIEGK